MAEGGAYSSPTCTYCGAGKSQYGWHRDHVTPKSWGSSRRETVLACSSCNGTKGNRDPVLWFAELVRRYGAVVGRDDSHEDRVATRIWELWGDDIRAFGETLTNQQERQAV